MSQSLHEVKIDPRNADILISINGTLYPRDKAMVSVFDSGFVLGDGVWEGLRLHDGGIAFLREHIERLYEGAKAIFLDIGLAPETLVARIFGEGKDWSAGAGEAFGGFLDQRLARLSAWLGDKEWLEGHFTVGDLMMVATLRIGVARERLPENLAAYVARGESRPAFKAALAAQFADFSEEPA